MNKERNERQTVTVEEAARLLGIGRSLAYEAVRRGQFPAPVIKVGRRYVVSREGLERVIAEGMAGD